MSDEAKRSDSDRTHRRHVRDKSVIDHLVGNGGSGDGAASSTAGGGGAAHSAETPAGQPVEEQVRKEWEPGEDGGLPTF
ncbi:MAG TPA: hypothetical protein VGD08_06675 [Stellaceae bacterium]|jgi:hypothetical protein